MTVAQIVEMSAAMLVLHFEMPKRHKAELQAARQNLNKLQEACDHKLPDGTDAHESLMFMTACRICHANDM